MHRISKYFSSHKKEIQKEMKELHGQEETVKPPSQKETAKPPSQKETVKPPSQEETAKPPSQKETAKPPSQKEMKELHGQEETAKPPSQEETAKPPSQKETEELHGQEKQEAQSHKEDLLNNVLAKIKIIYYAKEVFSKHLDTSVVEKQLEIYVNNAHEILGIISSTLDKKTLADNVNTLALEIHTPTIPIETVKDIMELIQSAKFKQDAPYQERANIMAHAIHRATIHENFQLQDALSPEELCYAVKEVLPLTKLSRAVQTKLLKKHLSHNDCQVLGKYIDNLNKAACATEKTTEKLDAPASLVPLVPLTPDPTLPESAAL